MLKFNYYALLTIKLISLFLFALHLSGELKCENIVFLALRKKKSRLLTRFKTVEWENEQEAKWRIDRTRFEFSFYFYLLWFSCSFGHDFSIDWKKSVQRRNWNKIDVQKFFDRRFHSISVYAIDILLVRSFETMRSISKWKELLRCKWQIKLNAIEFFDFRSDDRIDASPCIFFSFNILWCCFIFMTSIYCFSSFFFCFLFLLFSFS